MSYGKEAVSQTEVQAVTVPPPSLRDQCVADLKKWVLALQPHTSPAGARIAIAPPRATAYPPVWEALQGYARPLWGMAALASSGEASRLGDEVWERWRSGIAAGTNPLHEEYWGETGNRSQAYCEMAPIALSLVWAADTLWHPQPSSTQGRILEWLNQINRHKVPENNWLWFRVLVNLSLQRLGGDNLLAQIDSDLEQLDAMSQPHGWYTDGRKPGGRAADGYIPSAFHVYGLITAEELKTIRPDISMVLQKRAREFAQDWRWFQNHEGRSVPWGRSLGYRWTPAAFWSACAWADLPVLDWEELAWCWRSQRRWWSQQPVMDSEGLPVIGFERPLDAVGESYIARTSLYWLTKNFLALRQPDTHPFWSAGERPPANRPGVLELKGCGGLLTGTGEAPLLLLTGQQGPKWLFDRSARYQRFAYDTRHGFQLPQPGDPETVDHMILFRSRPWHPWVGRRGRETWRVENGRAELFWSPETWLRIHTILTPLANGYQREHHIQTDRAVDVMEGGFPFPPGKYKQTHHRIRVEWDGRFSQLEAEDSRKAAVDKNPSGENLLQPDVVIPILKGRFKKGHHRLITRATCGKTPV